MGARLQPNAKYQARAHLLDEMISMDPALAGPDPAERYGCSRRLLEEALAAFEACSGAKPHADVAANQTAVAASEALKRTVRPRSFGEATRTNTSIAAALWNERGKLCGVPGLKYEALARLMADVAR